MDEKINIAVLLTCFNRKDMTTSCLLKLKHARDSYNERALKKISTTIYLTDDKCTDGTPDAVRECMVGEDLYIIEANGNAFWAGGMRLAWREAVKHGGYVFYLLLNDDSDPLDNIFDQLFEAHQYAVEHYGKAGIYSGNTSWKKDHNAITFGGKVAKGRFLKRFERVIPSGQPQPCEIVNANILMVSASVVDKIGIFPDCYKHGAADNDYGKRANKAGLPVLVTSGFCGRCDADNYDYKAETEKLNNMSIKQRVKYFDFPTRSISDTIAFSIRWRRSMVPIILLMHWIHILAPKMYYKLFSSNV